MCIAKPKFRGNGNLSTVCSSLGFFRDAGLRLSSQTLHWFVWEDGIWYSSSHYWTSRVRLERQTSRKFSSIFMVSWNDNLANEHCPAKSTKSTTIKNRFKTGPQREQGIKLLNIFMVPKITLISKENGQRNPPPEQPTNQIPNQNDNVSDTK